MLKTGRPSLSQVRRLVGEMLEVNLPSMSLVCGKRCLGELMLVQWKKSGRSWT